MARTPRARPPDITIPTFADAELIQAQRTVRSFLEIAAAGFDRAFVHDLRDSDAISGVGAWDRQTGLLTFDGTPKISWYWVYSLKNILKGKKFVEQIIPPGCGGDETNCNSSCPRIYKFGNGCGETVFAIWSPSSDGSGCSYNFNLDLQCGNVATGIKLMEGNIAGLETQLTINASGQAEVPVTETPIFVVERNANAPVINCSTFIIEEAKTCNSVTIAINDDGLPITSYQIWYALASDVQFPNKPDFSPFAMNGSNEPIWHQYQHDVPANSPNVLLSGLEPSTSYLIYVIPQSENGLAVDGSGGPAYCHLQVATLDQNEGSCALQIAPSMVIFDSNIAPQDEGGLFDQQNSGTFDDCALPDLTDDVTYPPFLDYQNEDPQAMDSRTVIVDLGANFLTDQFLAFDGNSSGVFTFEGSLDNASYQILTQYYTNSQFRATN